MLGSMVEISALMTTYGYVKRTLGEARRGRALRLMG